MLGLRSSMKIRWGVFWNKVLEKWILIRVKLIIQTLNNGFLIVISWNKTINKFNKLQTKVENMDNSARISKLYNSKCGRMLEILQINFKILDFSKQIGATYSPMLVIWAKSTNRKQIDGKTKNTQSNQNTVNKWW